MERLTARNDVMLHDDDVSSVSQALAKLASRGLLRRQGQ